MPVANVLEAALAFITMVGVVRAVASIRLRGAGKSKREGHDVAKNIALGLFLASVPVARVTAAQAAAPVTTDVHTRHAAIASPELEFQALGDTLSFDQRWLARPDGTARALQPRAEARPAAEAELDALTAATMDENAVHGAVTFAPRGETDSPATSRPPKPSSTRSSRRTHTTIPVSAPVEASTPSSVAARSSRTRLAAPRGRTAGRRP
jgi:hypothetical protein